MNVFELVGFLFLVALVIFGSRGLGHLLAMPELALVIPVVGFLVLMLRAWKKIPRRALLILSSLLAAASFLSIALARILGLREPILATPVAVGIIFIGIQSKLLPWRTKTDDANARG